MSKHNVFVNAEIELFQLEIEPEDLSGYIMNQEDIDYDVDFLNAYCSKSNWRSAEEMEAVATGLSAETKSVMRTMLELAEQTELEDNSD